MKAKIYKPSKTAMSSGQAKTKNWIMEIIPETGKDIDPLMGWTSSADTKSQVKIKFESEASAIRYAEENNIEYIVLKPKDRKVNIRPNGYGDNFSYNRKTPWTH